MLRSAVGMMHVFRESLVMGYNRERQPGDAPLSPDLMTIKKSGKNWLEYSCPGPWWQLPLVEMMTITIQLTLLSVKAFSLD